MKRKFTQGSLDGLCGIYSIVNAANFIAEFEDEQDVQLLFNTLLQKLDDKKMIFKAIKKGIGT